MRTLGKYRQRMRQKDQGYRPGVVFRSRREEVGAWSTLVVAALCFGAMAIPDYSVSLTIAANLGIATLIAMCWFAWVVWGRDRFPLRENQQSA